MALEAAWRAGSVGMSPDGHAYRQAHRCVLVKPGPWGKPTRAPSGPHPRRQRRGDHPVRSDIVPGGTFPDYASGEPIVRYEPAPPMTGTTGDIEALSMRAGQGVALAKKSQPAADIVTELTSRL